jgi:putative toxin-antitoxin system antitoxin component (TIGR02293 family)
MPPPWSPQSACTAQITVPADAPKRHQTNMARVLSQAESVYETRERALGWLRAPNPRCGKRAPLELLKTDAGSRIVEDLLVQIDEGSVSGGDSGGGIA